MGLFYLSCTLPRVHLPSLCVPRLHLWIPKQIDYRFLKVSRNNIKKKFKIDTGTLPKTHLTVFLPKIYLTGYLPGIFGYINDPSLIGRIFRRIKPSVSPKEVLFCLMYCLVDTMYN